jgi:hypothetical protein
VRLITLGLDAEATKLREKYSKGEEFDNFRGDVGLRDRNIRILSTLVDRFAATADFSSNEAARSTMAKYLKVLVPLRDDMLAMDEFDRQHQFYKPYLQSMEDVLRKLVTAMALGLQTLSDRAVKELGTGKSADGKATLLLIREQIEGSILPSVDKVLEKRTIANTKITLVPTEIKDGSGVIRDAFDKSRTVKVSTYTPGQQNVRDLEGTVRDIFFRRAEQVALLARIYGQTDVLRKDRPGEKSQIEDARQNAEVLKTVIAAGGQLRLDSDDDWRAFVLAKYKQMTTGTGAVDKATAFSAVMKLLYDYLAVFTVHARFTNIYDQGDFKDAYFNKPFPRTLSGEMVQDCGVYAMRVAYILSLVRDELSLTFKFIRLPAHVGLIISGTDLPLYVAHNNHYREITKQKLDELRDGWKKAAPRFATVHKDTPIDEEQLIGEVASTHYISGDLSTPFRISEVPGSGKTPVDTQKALWKEYTTKVSDDVFGTATEDKKSPGYLFHNRYLGVTERYRELHNDYSVPFWNVKAPAAWKELEDALRGGERTELAGSDLAALLEAHVSALGKAEESHKVAKDRIKSTETELSKKLREVPKLKALKTRASREGAIITVGHWEDSLDEYRTRIATMIADAQTKPGDKFTVTTVISTLNPPFIPVSEKGLRFLDL